MPKFEVIRYYTACDIYEVEAADEDDAYAKAKQGEGHKKYYHSDEDDNYEVTQLLENSNETRDSGKPTQSR